MEREIAPAPLHQVQLCIHVPVELLFQGCCPVVLGRMGDLPQVFDDLLYLFCFYEFQNQRLSWGL